MRPNEFEDFISEICDYFQKSKPKRQTGDLWYQEVKNIPSESLNFIKKRVFLNRFPDNIPRTLWGHYQAWLDENPHKREHREQGCPECDSGYLWAVKGGNHYVFRCSNCMTARENYPKSTPSRLIAAGYEMDWIHHIKDRHQKINLNRWSARYGGFEA